MDVTVINGLIVGGCTLAAGVIGALIANPDFRSFFRRSEYDQITGTWDSTWSYEPNHHNPYREKLVIEKQNGKKISGYITIDSEPKKKWELEGIFTGRYLQLCYYPSRKKAEDDLFLGNGCYFFEQQSDGTFKGFSIGINESKHIIDSATHQLKRLSKMP